MPDYIIRQRGRGQAEAKCLRPRLRPKLRGRGGIFEAEAKILEHRNMPANYEKVFTKQAKCRTIYQTKYIQGDPKIKTLNFVHSFAKY